MDRDRRNINRISAVTLLLAGGAVACGVAYGNPTAPQVVNGQASFVTQGNTLTVTNSPGTIINWQSFSNAADEVTRFVQQSSTSSVLNRVVGVDPSTILGTIQSNGRVFLINPNGILFGPNSRIDVNGLIASTLPLSNADFLAGRFSATAGPVAEAIRNQGAITTPAGGKVWLIAPEVENSGIITAPEGDILLAAGRSVHLVDSTDPDIAVVVSAPEDKVLNLGRIVADSGKVGIYGGLISQKGVVTADSAVVGKDGRIFFKSTHGTTLGTGSITTASGAKGGDITVSAIEGNTVVSGTISATGGGSTGGSVKVLGKVVSLLDGSRLDVSGASGGGSLLVGGDFQGKNPAVQNAQTTYVAKDALLRADAGTTGDGGKIIVWSDGSTRAYGNLSARGGSLGGNGGLIETSGHFLSVTGSTVDAAAPRGMAGTWLLDPLNIVIAGTSINVDVLSDTPSAGTDTIRPNTTTSEIFASEISSRLDAGTNVIVTTSVAGGEAGNITVNSPISKSGASPAATLLLDAAGDIILNQSIMNTSSTPLDVTLTAVGAISSSGGSVSLSYGTLTANAGAGISLSGNVPTFSATNGASGGITFNNGGALTVNSITQNSSTPVVITSSGNMSLGTINAAGGGVVTLRAHNGAISDFNSVSTNVSGAYRVDFNDGSSTTPAGVGSNLDAIEVANLGAGGVTAQAGDGGIYIANTSGSLKLGGISYNGTSGDVIITSSTDTTITGALGSLSGHTGNMTVDVANAPLTIDAAVNKGGSGTLLLKTTGASSDVSINSNILGNGNGVSIQAGRDILFNGRDTGAGIVDNTVFGTSLDLISSGGNIFGALAQLSTGGATVISAPVSGTVSLTNANNSLSGTITVSGGNNVSITTSGNMTVGPASQAGILTLQSVNGSITGSSPLGGTQLNASAAAGIDLTAPNTPVTVNLSNGTSGNVSYSSSVGGAMTLTVTGSSSAGGTFSVNETTGNLRVGAAGISTADGGIILATQKSGGTLLVAGPANAGLGDIELSGYNLSLQNNVSGNAVRLKANGAGSGTLSVSGTPTVAAGSVIDLWADNMSLTGGEFMFSNGTPTNTISLRTVSDNRPITIGSACTMPGCLLLSDLSDGLFSGPQLRIGNHISADPDTAGNIDVSSSFNRNGMLSLLSGGSITQSPGATIGVNSLALSGASVDLRQANPVGVVAGRSVSGNFLYRSQNLLTLSFVDGFSGVSATGSVWLESDSTLGIYQNGGRPVSTPGALVLSTIGPVNLMDGGNNVGTLAADLFRSGTGGGGLQFSNGPKPLIINSALGISGIRTNNQPIMVMAGGTSANGLFVRNAVNGGTSFVNLAGPSVFLDSGSTVTGGNVRLSAIEPTGLGRIVASGPTAPIVQASKSIELEADNLSFSINPSFTVSNLDVRNEISLSTHTSGRPITVGTACAFGACLLLNNVSTTLFNAPTLVIGSEDMLPTTSTKTPIVAGDITIASAITRAGRLALLTGGSISQSAPISVDAMAVVAPGAVNLTASNSVGKLAALTDGPFAFTTTGPLDVVTVIGGIEDPATIEGVDSLGNITLTSGGNLTLNAPIDAGNQTVTLKAGGAIIDAVDDSLYSASIYAGDLDLTAANGIGSMATPLATDVLSLFADNTGAGDVVIENVAGLEVLDVSSASGAVELAALVDDLILSGPVFAATDVYLAAETGSIIDNNGGLTTVEADFLDAFAAKGIGSTAAPLVTTVASLAATAGGGDVVIKNTGVLTIDVLSTGGTGSVFLDNVGAVTTGASAIQAPGGSVTMIARSPLNIGSGGVTASGNILLEAAASGSGDNMVVAGDVFSSNGSIALRAGNTVTITGSVSAPNGTATKTEELNTPPGKETDLKGNPDPLPDPVITDVTKDVVVATGGTLGSDGTVGGGTVGGGTVGGGTTGSGTTGSGTTGSGTTGEGTTGDGTTGDGTTGDGTTGDGTTEGEPDEDQDDKKKDAEKKQENVQKDGEKKDAPKKKQYCN